MGDWILMTDESASWNYPLHTSHFVIGRFLIFCPQQFFRMQKLPHMSRLFAGLAELDFSIFWNNSSPVAAILNRGMQSFDKYCSVIGQTKFCFCPFFGFATHERIVYQLTFLEQKCTILEAKSLFVWSCWEIALANWFSVWNKKSGDSRQNNWLVFSFQ